MEKEKTVSAGTDPAKPKPHEIKPRSSGTPSQNQPDRIWQIACTFPALRSKGVLQGDIPGLRPEGFDAGELHEFLYHGAGSAFSSGERLLLEFLLNLSSPEDYPVFNFGRAVRMLGDRHLAALIDAVDIPDRRGIELYAGIKSSSKYFDQGIDAAGKPRIFRIEAVRSGIHLFRLNNNNYRVRDLAFFVKDAQGHLVPIDGGEKR